jgi:hypothetical protein
MSQLANIPDSITANDLVDLLQGYWGMNGDAELARELGVERWSVGQYRKRQGFADIPSKIIINLLRDIGYLEAKLSAAQSVIADQQLTNAGSA